MTRIDAAFRSSRKDEVYLFFKNMYVRVLYTPGARDDKIITTPRLIRDGFPSLKYTPFGNVGIDCAFDTEGDEAFIFSGDLCAYIDYAPGTANDKILSGPMTIGAMFPFLKNTVFASGIDSAYRSTQGKQVYLFKGDKYARIDYGSKKLTVSIRPITAGFTVFQGTIFGSGIEAAFASHRHNEVYLFKGDNYVRILATPGSSGDSIISQVQPTLSGWPCLRGILPLN